ncbi:MAG: hypothetical protein IKQ70_10070 [Bacteroidales bacterium]|nr:hypothetical protein [Bacteroidales bacterium]
MERYIIKEKVFSPYQKYQAILEAQINTSQYIKDSNNDPYIYNDKSTVMYMMQHVYDALINTTYTRRNTRTQLDLGYNVVFITDGEDYTTNIDGSIDTIEVRAIQTDKVALRYSIERVTH